MGHQYQGHRFLQSNLSQDLQDTRRVFRVQVPRGLIRQEEPRLMHQSPSQGSTLHLAPAQLMREMPSAGTQFDKFQEFCGALGCSTRPDSLQEQRQLDIFLQSHRRQQIEKLKHQTEVVPTILGQSFFISRMQGNPRHFDLSCRGTVQPAE